jgi:hypothetical protein
MSKPTTEQLEKAIALLKDINKVNPEEKQIFIVQDSAHMYSKVENAIAQAKGKDVYALKLGEKEAVLVEQPKEGKPSMTVQKSETPDASWKMDELREYAAKNSIALEATDKSKEAVLTKIAAASAPTV